MNTQNRVEGMVSKMQFFTVRFCVGDTPFGVDLNFPPTCAVAHARNISGIKRGRRLTLTTRSCSKRLLVCCDFGGSHWRQHTNFHGRYSADIAGIPNQMQRLITQSLKAQIVQLRYRHCNADDAGTTTSPTTATAVAPQQSTGSHSNYKNYYSRSNNIYH